MTMAGIYLSGTGNTRHCVEMLVGLLDHDASCVPIESPEAHDTLAASDTVVFGYPTQFSNIPKMVRDFIEAEGALWKDKQVICLTTMGAFSGDGTGCAARILKRYGAEVVGGLQIHMPDSVCDKRALKKSLEENQRIVVEADEKIASAAEQIKQGNYPREGLSPLSHLAGLFGQRLWFYGKARSYSDKLKIGRDCNGCGTCARVCPMGNIKMVDGKPQADARCTMCYRCISLCPQKAITLLGDQVVEQCRYEKYSLADPLTR